jgi:hypothetical protein
MIHSKLRLSQGGASGCPLKKGRGSGASHLVAYGHRDVTGKKEVGKEAHKGCLGLLKTPFGRISLISLIVALGACIIGILELP